MTAKNDITGDSIKTKPGNDKYAEGWERIFGKTEGGMKEGEILVLAAGDSVGRSAFGKTMRITASVNVAAEYGEL